MKRAALLIASEHGGRPIPGVYKDIISLENFFLSDIGGAWDEHEIMTLTNPSKLDVKSAIDNFLTKADYAFVSCSSHGFHSEKYNVTKVCLSDCELDVVNLFPKTPWGTVLVDCCRGLEDDTLTESGIKASAEHFSYKRSRGDYRKAFDSQVLASEKGEIILYSCAVGESAADNNPAIDGSFTRNLISCASQSMEKVYTIDLAFDCASENFRRFSPNQTPKLEAGRRRKYFPLAIHL